ncbi:sensor histidine kinase [Pseudonocardia sp. ICBG601]|uniref:sensor histidine kinase n=1 Tax=Pseudonocardia sp. ICBG601 TaxID=2846759 RepID=UPI001CF6CE9A|nr:histidine kinase [Pseudonocardia sp. ICBG601]
MWGPIARVLVPALVVGLFTAGGTAFTVARIARYPDPGTTALPLDVLAVVLLAAGPVALLFRHLDRVVALAVCAAAVVVYLGLGYPLMGPLGFAFAVALVSAVAAGHHHRALAVVVVAAAVLTGWLLVTGRPIPWPATAPVLAWLAALVAAGALWRVRRERTAQARRAAEAERRRSADAERLRIAQELHDVLGHHVSLINVQAGVALYLMDDDPEQARTALTEIKRASRDLLREMRSTLGVLRGVDEQAPRAPTPRSGPARRAARRGARRGATGAARHRGDPAAVADGGRPGRVPDRAGVADQHASARGGGHRGGHALRFGDDALDLTVDDDGAGPAPGAVDGTGLTGMRERARSVGGTLAAGPGPEQGFRVHAHLPAPPAGPAATGPTTADPATADPAATEPAATEPAPADLLARGRVPDHPTTPGADR